MPEAAGVAELAWTAQGETRVETPECVLLLDPVLGLTDIDFHQVTDEGWDNLSASSPASAARLVVPPSTSVNSIRQAIDTVAKRGGYAKVFVTIGDV
jgi:hypothetical protein